MKYHPDVLAAHAEFGGDLQSMQALYDRPDHIARIAALEAQLAERASVLDRLVKFAEKQKAHHNAKQREFPSIEQCVDEDGALRPAQNLYALLQGEAANGRYSEADWWLCTIRAEIDALSALEATPPAPKVTEAMVDVALKAFHSVGRYASDKAKIKAALTAAQEAGK